METMISSTREWIGNNHFMKQLERQYNFPVSVYKEHEDGTRTLLRTEVPTTA